MASGSAADIGPARVGLHVLLGCAGWLAFVALWIWQLAVYVPANWAGGVELIGLFILAFALASPAWVWWNRNIYRRRHRRTKPLVRDVQFDRDSLGRPVAVEPSVLLNPVEIKVVLTADGTLKRYSVPERAAAPKRAAEPERTARETTA